MKRRNKRAISLFLAVLMAFTGILPAATAFAGDGVEGSHDIELFYKDTNTIIPTYIDDTAEEKQNYVEYMKEGQELNLKYELIDTIMPDNGYVKWYSETPTLVDVTQEGVVKAFDSSKGAVVHSWIDNEVKTIPLIGSILGQLIEKALFNEYIDIETMDTDAIIEVVEGVFTIDTANPAFEAYKDQLLTSLRYYLDNINSNIHVQLFSADGTLLDDDMVQICVQKNEEWYANFLPNGTHITNKSQINTTVAVGSTTQIYAVTTPVRLNFKCVYSVKSSSIFDKGKVVATVNDSGLVTFKNPGKVTIMVSPDTEQIIQNFLKLINYFYALENTGTINTDKIAGILIDYIGIDINRTVLAAILDTCFAIKDIAGDAADPVQLTATAVEVISNLVLQFVYNDTIEFEVVESKPLEDFSIEGPTSVKEGAQIKMEITNIKPEAGNVGDITWRSSDPSIASVDPITGVITGRDAGGSLGNLSSQQCTIYAVSAANKVEKAVNITVTGRTGKYLSDVEITGDSYLEMSEECDYSYAIYPKRITQSDNLYVKWGMKTGVDEEGNPVYEWTDPSNPESQVTDGLGTLNAMGHYTVVGGGITTIAVQAKTGYYLSNGDFYEISSFLREFEVTNGIPVDNIKITATGATSNGTLNKVQNVTINGKEYTYATIHKNIAEAYLGNGAIINAEVYPANASNKNVTWVVDNKYYKAEVSEDTHTVTVKQQAGHEVADTFNVYAVSADGEVLSNAITVCVTRNYATSNTIDQASFEMVKGYTADASHTMNFDGDWTGDGYACKKANWYSSDEGVFTVETKSDSNAVITGVDVGTATLYCVSADGGIVDSRQVTVYPDKEYLRNIVNLCDNTVVKRTPENRKEYNQYMRRLDLAYSVLYNEPMASQVVCDTTAGELLYAFYKLGGFVSITGVEILGTNKTPLANDHITIPVDLSTSYKKYSYDFDFGLLPKNAMYSDIEWTSSNSKITVDDNGRCYPNVNEPASAIITCTVKDYMGNAISDTAYITFANYTATGVSLDTDNIEGGKIGETQQLKATVYPDKLVGGASCKDVYWSSSDEEIATVDQNGVVSFKEGGNCIIYCTTYDGGFVAQCTVNVVTNYTPLTLLVQQYRDLALNEINYFPDSWADFQAKMSEAQAMIDQGGHSQNEVDEMYAQLEQSYKSLKKYNYLQKVELYLDGEATKEFYQYDVSFLSEGISYKNAILDLNVRLYPNNGSYASVKWESSTTDISVTNDGKCSPTINECCYGKITCTVTDHYGSTFTDSVWVSYSYYPVTGMDLSDASITGTIGTTYQLSCTVLPTGTSLPPHIGAASIQDFYWESADPSIATVDENGLVTFVNAGATVVRAVSYDGGVTGECQVSSQGDRSALRATLERLKDVDYKEYDSNYGNLYKQAYDAALAAMTDINLSQEGIDEADFNLNSAYDSMIEHPFIKVDSVDVNYVTRKKIIAGKYEQVSSGTIGDNNSVAVNIKDYALLNYDNDIILTASAQPGNSMYKSVEWTVDSSNQMKSSANGASITLTPKVFDKGGWAIVTAKITDNYDRVTQRTVYVVLSESMCSGFDITQTETTVYANAPASQIAYTMSGSSEFPTVFWSSSNEAVVRVDGNGVMTPVDKGTATITGRTLDGGYTDKIVVNVQVDFSALASKYGEYFELVENVKDSYTYTQESLEVLTQRLTEAQTMINENKATQADVNNMIALLDDAYNNLVPYVATKGLTIGFEEDPNKAVTSTEVGYIRYTGTLLNGKTINLFPDVQPANSIYTSINWMSSNPDIPIDQNGMIVNNAAKAGVTLVQCTVTNISGESFTATAYVSFVRYGANGVSFDKEMVFGAPAQTVTVNPKVTNTNNSSLSSAVVKACKFTTSDPDIATVDENGVVTFVSQGVATITAIALDGGFKATLQAYTTWDTTALKAAIDEASAITYTDYAYEYGTPFNEALTHANEVYADVYASQATIDAACTALTETMAALEGHEFVTPEISLLSRGEILNTTDLVQVDKTTQQATLSAILNDGAMAKSTEITVSEENGVTAVVDGTNVLITKTATTGSLKVTVTVTDDYDRAIVKEYTLNIIEDAVNVTSIVLTADGEVISGNSVVRSCGGTYTNFTGLTISYIPTPENANSVASVAYTSSAKNYVVVDANGLVTLTTAGKIRSSNTATITCTVTNVDGTSVSSSVVVTITRA